MTLIQAIRKLASDYPDTRYPVQGHEYCEYTRGECGPGAGCIVGQALQMSGLTSIAEDADESGECGVGSLFEKMGIKNFNDQKWLSRVQSNQDFSFSWSGAVADADRVFA